MVSAPTSDDSDTNASVKAYIEVMSYTYVSALLYRYSHCAYTYKHELEYETQLEILERRLEQELAKVTNLSHTVDVQRAHIDWTQNCYENEVVRVRGLLQQVDYHATLAHKRGVYDWVVTVILVFVLFYFYARELSKGHT